MDSCEPDLSVIVIVYNDADRLPTAVRSVLDQTKRSLEIIIVDDASTDTTHEVARRLASEHPGLIRVIRLPSNSGGGGRPRNVGLEHARGGYVMFLDSDDTLDRHACRTMHSIALSTGADLVSGLCVQVVIGARKKPREAPWFARLYRTSSIWGSLADHPDLLYDTLSTNKCYRRSFLDENGLRFPEGLPHEDLLFVTRCYLAAHKIALTPHRIYNWFVHPRSKKQSVSSRRGDIKQFADRIVIHRMLDQAFEEHGDRELKIHKDVKFVNHDIRVYVAEYAHRDAGYQREFRRLAREYLQSIDPAALARCKKPRAIAAFLIRQDDHEGLLAISDYLGVQGRFTGDLVERDNRIYWCDRHLDTEEGRRILDVTSLGLHSLPLGKLNLAGVVKSFTTAGSEVMIDGELSDPLGRVSERGLPQATLQFASRGRRSRFEVPVTLSRAGTRIRWQAQFSLTRRMLRISNRDSIWDLGLRLSMGDQMLVCPVSDPAAAEHGQSIAVRPMFGLFPTNRLEPYRTGIGKTGRGGDLAFRLVPRSRSARAVRFVSRKLAETLPLERLLDWIGFRVEETRRAWCSRAFKATVYRRVLCRLPIRRGTVVFESHLGKQYSDSPRSIYEHLRDTDVPIKPIWSYAAETPAGFPAGARLVQRDSWAYFRALARAEFWVDNQGFPAEAIKRPGTTYIQTWHGSAFKRMGVHEPGLMLAPTAARARLEQMVRRFDCFLVRSEHDVRTLTQGLGVQAELLPVGYPRNDALVMGGNPAELDELRRELGLTDGRKVLLYAPTFRTGPGGRIQPLQLPFDPARFVQELGHSYVLLVRAHYMSAQPGLTTPCGTVRDVSHLHDVTSLLLISDALITDYSSIMFDFALLDRPMVFHAPDLEEYVRDRGSYFDLAERAPGPITEDEEALLGVLASLEDQVEAYRPQRRRFVEEFGEYDAGTAAKAVVERFFVRGARRG